MVSGKIGFSVQAIPLQTARLSEHWHCSGQIAWAATCARKTRQSPVAAFEFIIFLLAALYFFFVLSLMLIWLFFIFIFTINEKREL
jgi:hypothetical protein